MSVRWLLREVEELFPPLSSGFPSPSAPPSPRGRMPGYRLLDYHCLTEGGLGTEGKEALVVRDGEERLGERSVFASGELC